MDNTKRKAIQAIVNASIKNFANGFEIRYTNDVNNPKGVINAKKNNCFIAELGEEFIFYSAFVRSFDSSFGNVLESIGNDIASVSYEVKGDIDSFILPEQTQHISSLMSSYEKHIMPQTSHYANYFCIIPPNISSFKATHPTDNYLYNPDKHEHYLIELKAGGDIDNKKSKAEKIALLEEYFLLKNLLQQNNKTEDKVYIYFATAYNKFGEGNEWKQERVQQFFANEELLIGKDYWNFVCNDENGFDIVFEQYQKSCKEIEKINIMISQMFMNYYNMIVK
ncbi:MAG: TdeIII family type II restriction endonuclease [Acutalibacteraceae bacterium]